MATLKAVVNPEIRKDDTYSVHIRLTHKGVIKKIPTSHYLDKSQVNKKFEIRDTEIIDELNTTIKNYRKKISSLSTDIDYYTCSDLKEYLANDIGKTVDFIKYGLQIAGKQRTEGTKALYITVINRFVDLFGERVDINHISLASLKRFEAFLRSGNDIERVRPNGSSVTYKGRVTSNSTIGEYMVKLKTIYKEAMKEYNDRGRIVIPYNPFDKYDIPQREETKSRNLDIEIIKAIRDCPDFSAGLRRKTNIPIIARDVAMLSFYFIGMNPADMFQVDDYNNGRLGYNRAKTRNVRKDNAFISIKVEPEAMPIIEKYRDKTGLRVFNFYQMFGDQDVFAAAINRGLRFIDKEKKLNTPKISLYYIRYSWMNIARNGCRIHKEDIAMAANHSDKEHRTTDIYLDKDWSIIDEANRKVLDKLLE